jgi:hypothetical protein
MISSAASRGEAFEPTLGTGRIEITVDGHPTCRAWIHVDDILLHGLALEDVIAALDYAMDLALELGLIFQAAKTSPPASKQKFCGCIYDTTDVPTRRVPANKISRALALLSFVRREVNGPLAQLGLSVVTGVLQSLVPATPENVGSNYLSSLYTDLCRDMDPGLRGHRAAYYDPVTNWIGGFPASKQGCPESPNHLMLRFSRSILGMAAGRERGGAPCCSMTDRSRAVGSHGWAPGPSSRSDRRPIGKNSGPWWKLSTKSQLLRRASVIIRSFILQIIW